MDGIEFGAFLVPEDNEYSTLRGRATLCDELGYDSLWVSDHLVGLYKGSDSPRLECWTTVAVLDAITEKTRLGQLCLAAPFRNPALLAKMAATLDVITDGRAILSIGAGWHGDDFNAYGYRFGNVRDRLERLEEAAQIIKLMWTQDAPSFEGKHYRIHEAYCVPKPIQKPCLPLMVAGGGERHTLKTAARAEFEHKTRILERYCRNVGRDPDEITKTWGAFVLIDERQEDAERTAKNFYTDQSRTSELRGLIGTPENIAQSLHEYTDRGATHFILSFLGGDFEKEATLFMEEVVPSV
jgi:alkanesulfonate monooxygenase SsuD/methylene tetrahydromethanopterin reductase-like flavin-dependent oxidoreductase (luciferase family)